MSKARSSSSRVVTLICCSMLILTFGSLPRSSADPWVPVLPYSGKFSLCFSTCAVAWIVAAQGQKGFRPGPTAPRGYTPGDGSHSPGAPTHNVKN